MAMLSASTALGWALRAEASGEVFYREAARRSQNRDVRLLFEDLAYQEERHHRTFERMLAQVPPVEDTAVDPAEYEAYLGATLEHALIGGPEKGLQLAKDAADEAAALRAAIAFEKDTLLFFHDLRNMVPAEHREMISAIVAEESSHLRQLGKVLLSGPWVS